MCVMKSSFNPKQIDVISQFVSKKYVHVAFLTWLQKKGFALDVCHSCSAIQSRLMVT